MALIKCPECGMENVSSMATSCPRCGFPIKEHHDLYVAKQETFSGSKYCDVATGVADMFFGNGVEPGTTGKCTVFDDLGSYYVSPDGKGIFVNCEKNNARWTIVGEYLLPPCGSFSGQVPDGNEFVASCSNSVVGCENLSFFDNCTFLETASGETTAGVYIRRGNLIALCKKGCLQPKVYVVYNQRLWDSCRIKDEKVFLLTELTSACLELASSADNISVPILTTKEENIAAPPIKEKSIGWTIAKIWFWIILAFVGGLGFVSEGNLLLAAICCLVFPLIAFWTYVTGPSALHKMMDNDAKKRYDKRVSGGYKCPNCGCSAGHPIGAIDKGVSVGAYGLASNKIGKTYKCDKCGYMW